ncbi:MAG TPA: DNA repair and recombination protein RadA [Nautiliaceae bacterium]|nr:DNA repair and recombination protein RadA [Nautiliaceae bacterium]
MGKKNDGKKEASIYDIPGVGEKTAEKLIEFGYDDLMKLATTSSYELAEVLGIGEALAKKIVEGARKLLKMGFESGYDILQKRNNYQYITFGSKALDELLGGKGVETGSITEFFGEFGSGKTQIAHQLAVNVQLSVDKGGLEKGAVYIDTEGTFRPERIIQMAKAKGLDPEKVLKNIKVARAYTTEQQMMFAEKIEDLIKEENFQVGVVVVDSLTSLFRAEYVGRGSLAERQQKLNQHMHTLQKLADLYNFAVIVTNQVMAKPDMLFGDPTSAIGGHIVGHNSTYRIYLRKGKKNTRVARLIDSPHLPEGESVFLIDEEGIKDVK